MSDQSNPPDPGERPRGMRRLWRNARHANKLGLAAGIAGAAALAIGTTASLGGFSASITNTGDQVSSGSLLMREDVTPNGGTTTTCFSTATGSVISTNANLNCTNNKFGALTNAVPGSTSSSTVVITNQGSVPANSFTIGVGSCTATPTAGPGAAAVNVGSDASFCNKVDVTIEDDTTAGSPKCIYPAGAGACPTLSNTYNLGTLSTFGATPVSLGATVGVGAARTYKVSDSLDATASTNADQAMAATEPITFTFGS